MDVQNEMSVTHIWTRINKRWLLAGAVSAIWAGIVVMLVATIGASGKLGEWSQPLKLIGATFFGGDATAYGPLGAAGMAGVLVHLGLSTLYGLVFAQLVHEESSRGALVILGLVTSFIIWIFGCQLFLPSFDITLKLMMPTRIGLFLHLFFGLSFGFFLGRLRPIFLRR